MQDWSDVPTGGLLVATVTFVVVFAVRQRALAASGGAVVASVGSLASGLLHPVRRHDFQTEVGSVAEPHGNLPSDPGGQEAIEQG